jgi:hypothetical protein
MEKFRFKLASPFVDRYQVVVELSLNMEGLTAKHFVSSVSSKYIYNEFSLHLIYQLTAF